MIRQFMIICALLPAAVFTACADTEPEYVEIEGQFLRSAHGQAMLIYDSGPASLSADDTLFTEFTDGDTIRIRFDGMIMESYPAQIANITGAELVEDGTFEDLPEDVIASLREMGWLEE